MRSPFLLRYYYHNKKSTMSLLRRNPVRKVRRSSPRSSYIIKKVYDKKKAKGNYVTLNNDNFVNFDMENFMDLNRFTKPPLYIRSTLSLVNDNTSDMTNKSSNLISSPNVTQSTSSSSISSPPEKRCTLTSTDNLQDSVIILPSVSEEDNYRKDLNTYSSDIISIDSSDVNVNYKKRRKKLKNVSRKQMSPNSYNSKIIDGNESIIVIEDDNETFKEVESSELRNAKTDTNQNLERDTNASQDDIAVIWTSMPENTSSKTTNTRNNHKTNGNNKKMGKQSSRLQKKQLSEEKLNLCSRTSKTDNNRNNHMRKKNKRKLTEDNNLMPCTAGNKTTSNENTNNLYGKNAGNLREIIVDGCNVGMAYTQNKTFSETGIKLVVDYFKKRGHVVKVFLPHHKRSTSRPLLEQMFKEGTVVFTPSRKIAGKKITSYDDNYILEYATLRDGIVISLDQYRDLYEEKPEWRHTIVNRLLQPTFVGDYVMFPNDPLGKKGPTLEEFLRY